VIVEKVVLLCSREKEVNITQIFACPNYIDVKIDEGFNKSGGLRVCMVNSRGVQI
jgi:hypothetical protein